MQKSEHAEALRTIEASIEQLPEVSLAHALRGVCLAALGRDSEALAAVQHADRLDPENDTALQFLVAVAGSRWRSRSLAREALERLEAISPSSASVALLRAGLELRAFRPLRAFRAARRSVSLDPENPLARALHAVFVSLRRRPRGSELMHQAMQLDPADRVLRDLAISTGLNYWRPSLLSGSAAPARLLPGCRLGAPPRPPASLQEALGGAAGLPPPGRADPAALRAVALGAHRHGANHRLLDRRRRELAHRGSGRRRLAWADAGR